MCFQQNHGGERPSCLIFQIHGLLKESSRFQQSQISTLPFTDQGELSGREREEDMTSMIRAMELTAQSVTQRGRRGRESADEVECTFAVQESCLFLGPLNPAGLSCRIQAGC